MVENLQREKTWTLPTTNIVFLDIETDGLHPSGKMYGLWLDRIGRTAAEMIVKP